MSTSSSAIPLPTAETGWNPTCSFWAFTIGHVLLWTLLSWLIMPNVNLDTVEMAYWGHEWQWGYYKHPPLPAWLAETCYVVSGNNVLVLLLVARICIGVCFWGVWSLGRRLVSERTALLAVIVLEASYFYTHSAYEINNNIVTRPMQVLSVLFLFLALFEKRPWAWFATGLCLGAGMLCKYDTAVLALLMLAYSLWESRGRKAWRTPGPYIMLATSVVIFLPHVWWLVENDFPTFSYLARSSEGKTTIMRLVTGPWRHIVFPLEFLAGQLALFAPVAAICIGVVWPGTQPRNLDEEGLAKRRFLLFLGIGPIVVFFAVSMLFAVRLSLEWGHNLWTWIPLAILYIWQPNESTLRLRKPVGWALAMGLLFVLTSGFRSVAMPYLGKTLCRHYPGRELSHQVEARWHEHFSAPLPIVAGDSWTASNVALYSPERPSVYCEMNPRFSLWLNDDLLRERGGVIVWEEGQAYQAGYRDAVSHFPGAYLVEPITCRFHTYADVPPLKLQVAIVPPAKHGLQPPAKLAAAPLQKH